MSGPDFIDGRNENLPASSRRAQRSRSGSGDGRGPRGRRPGRRANPSAPLSPFASWVARASRLMLVLVVISLVLALVGLGNMYRSYTLVKQSIDQVVNIQLPTGSQATEIYARDFDPKTGKGTLLGLIYEHNRQNVDYAELPPLLLACLLSTEDARFFEHRGVDLTGTARAVLVGVRRGGDIRGTSTITQQLARNVFLPFIRSERTLNRKVQEFVLAGALEKNFTKPEILQAYLNHIYLGHQAYGAKSAAKVYFGKELDKLTLGECALLAGLPQLPDANDPYKNPKGAEKRRRAVLKLLESRLDTDFLARLKQHDPEKFGELEITAEQMAEALKTEPKLQREGKPKLYRAEYFVSYLEEHVLRQKYGDSISRTGLRIVTTIDPQIQKYAEETLASTIDSVRDSKRVSQGAVVVLEAKTGEVLACVGGYKWGQPGRDGQPDQYNRAMMKGRQTGSSFKPFTYATAYEQGFPSGLMLWDGPYAPETKKTGKAWPKNSDHKYTGAQPMYAALQRSRNAASVDLQANCTGTPAVIETARRLGITAQLPEVPALTLGVSDIRPVEMANAFAAFANEGRFVKHTLVKRIYSQDNILIEADDNQLAVDLRSRPALKADTAWKMVQNLQLAVNAGTGGRARVPDVQIAGKTGTCDDFGDAWFVGISPELACAVWLGNDDFKRKMSRMYGGNEPAMVFSGVLKKVYGEGGVARYKQRKFEKPEGVEWAGVGKDGRIALNGMTMPGATKTPEEQAAEAEARQKKQEEEQREKERSNFYEPWNPPPDGNIFF